jgi:hypothetical protein
VLDRAALVYRVYPHLGSHLDQPHFVDKKTEALVRHLNDMRSVQGHVARMWLSWIKPNPSNSTPPHQVLSGTRGSEQMSAAARSVGDISRISPQACPFQAWSPPKSGDFVWKMDQTSALLFWIRIKVEGAQQEIWRC